jgi:uncharacterized protein YjbI with pentapeptide repeats
MANEQQLEVLLQGVEAWNAWRDENPHVEIDLTGANLERLNLNHVNFSNARLNNANLSFANLDNTDFSHAHLKNTNLAHAQLQKSHLAFANLERAVLLYANLKRADLRGALLKHAAMEDVNLMYANLTHANLEKAILANANLRKAELISADLKGANLTSANLEGANVSSVVYDKRIFWQVLKESAFNPKKIWKRKDDIILETNMRCNSAYTNCYGSPKFKTFLQDQDYIEEMMKTKQGRITCFIWWLVSDCGRSIYRWACCSLLLVILFTSIYLWIGSHHFYSPKLAFNFTNMFYYSIVTFTTLGGDIFPNTPQSVILTVLEVILGYIMLGGLISIFANKLARRGS